MPRFSLPKMPRFSPIFLLLIFIVLIIVAEAGYYYFKVIRKPSPPSELQRRLEEKGRIAMVEQEELKQEVETQQKEVEEKLILIEKCLQVYLENPKDGIYRLDKVGDNVFDYFYQGKITNVEEETKGGCLYTSLFLKDVNDFTIVLPSGLTARTDLGDVYPAIYEDHLDQRVELKIRYEHDPTNPKVFKIIEWQPLVFHID